MTFWITMFLVNMLIPAALIIMGAVFRRATPKKINRIAGYRSSWSMKSRETWEFAHKHSGKIMKIVGLVLFVVSAAVMALCFGMDEDGVGMFAMALCSAQCVVMIAAIFPTEIALRKNFDADGKRRAKPAGA